MNIFVKKLLKKFELLKPSYRDSLILFLVAFTILMMHFVSNKMYIWIIESIQIKEELKILYNLFIPSCFID